MSQVVIENPIINSPFAEPPRHFRFGAEGITNEPASGQRSSSHFVPIAPPRKRGQRTFFETGWVEERIRERSVHQRHPPPAGVVAAGWLPGRQAHHRALVGLLD